MRQLYLCRGAAGTGKSTWLKQNNLTRYTINVDEVRLLFQSPVLQPNGTLAISQKNDSRVWELVMQLVEERMARGEFTIVDATHSRASQINDYRKLCEKYRYRCYVLDFSDTPLEVILARNANRLNVLGEEHKYVPESAILNMYERITTQAVPGWVTKVKPSEFDVSGEIPIFDYNKYKRVHVIGDLHGCLEPLKTYVAGTYGFDSEFDAWIFVGDYPDRGPQNRELVEYLMALRDHKNILFLTGNHECIHKDSDVLTEIGWLRIEDLVARIDSGETIKVAQFDSCGTINYVVPLATITGKSDTLIRIESHNTCQYVTPGHEIIYSGCKLTAREFMKLPDVEQNNFTLTGMHDDQDENYISDDMLRLLTWVVSDGTIVGALPKKVRIQFKLSRTDKIEKLTTLLNRMRIPYTLRKATLGPTNKLQPYYICIYWKQWSGYIWKLLRGKKEFPDEFRNLSKRQLNIVLNAIEDTDGCRASDNKLTLTTINKHDIDVLQEVCTRNGFNVVYTEHNNASGFANGKLQYHCTIYYGIWNDKKVTREEVGYNDTVYCLNMPLGTLITRYNGKVAFTGNCWLQMYANDEIENIKSAEFVNGTMPQLEGIDKKILREWCRRFAQLAWFRLADKMILVNHGGLPNVPTIYTATDQIIRGTGVYEDAEITQQTWLDSTPNNFIQVHGHRNVFDQPLQESGRIYNLCDRVEYGGNLRVVRFEREFGLGNGISSFLIPNPVYSTPPTITKKLSGKIDMSVADMIAVMRNMPKRIQEKRFDVDGTPNKDGHISSFNFTRDVFYDDDWDTATTLARGMFVNNITNEIVARGYEKFFNINERSFTKVDELRNMQWPVACYKKENGFLGLVGYDSETVNPIITTKSSLTGDYIQWFKEAMPSELPIYVKAYNMLSNSCFVLECIVPEDDPHIIEYGQAHVVLLDVIQRDVNYSKLPYNDLVGVAKSAGIAVKQHVATFNSYREFYEFYRETQEYDFRLDGEYVEGFVYEDSEGFMTKGKTGYYHMWKFMRMVKDSIKGKRPIEMARFTTKLQNSVVAWLKQQPREVLDLDIITVRKLYMENAK